MLIKDLAVTWLDRLKTRKRKPCKPATIKNFSSAVSNHIIPLIGDQEVETFRRVGRWNSTIRSRIRGCKQL
jgi:hypothetical protein